ncbi:PLP-dependent aspartate aminotransferase family protein [Streptomyces sp. V1I1]|uniref:trans-sulfuration enzyme family protein n=1 Tax=Streptomyces sp. V1I1 TaxID=3042272 RepID=UPI00277D3D0B|nr:aminotransferase class I/II-fold pyridoxal phosphate-dependent enzyme [Streptomyces sp. V1I1]MDQ0939271.1 cystathionine beta-lyase/cystathionine gamma-synthase [Streptomyces sp. V1I1]
MRPTRIKTREETMGDQDLPHPETRAVHIAAPPLQGCRPLSVPIYQSSTFAFDDPDAFAEAMSRPDGAFVYSRRGNPTVRALEGAIADLEGGRAALATASGMGAISAVLLSLLSTGDHVIAQRCLYGGTYSLLSELSTRFGIDVTYVSGTDAEEVRAHVRPTTRLLYLETIANPTTRLADLPALLGAGRDAGLVTVVDNSFASPLLCRPIEHGADVVVHSSTKFLAGHSDVTGGVAVFATEDTYRACWKNAVELGATADPFAAWLTIRGLQTLGLRMRRHCDNAAHLARNLAVHPAVKAVHWPGHPDHPDHGLARRLLDGFGGVLAFDLAGGRGAGRTFLSAVRLACLAPSLGGVETLVLHPASTSHRELDTAALQAADIGEGTVRVSVGLEHPDDLWHDFEQALSRI